jgi:hypothetical protein
MKAATVMMIMMAVMAVGVLAERGETGDERGEEGTFGGRGYEEMARKQFRTAFDVEASTGRAPRSSPSKIAVCGSSYYAYVASMLQASLPGVTVDSYSTPPSTASALSAYQTILLLRTPGNTELANWVKNGGRLITEWNAAQWALDQVKLLGAGTKTNTSGYVGSSTPITFISPGEGLSKGLHNPYSDDGRSEYFFSFFVDPTTTTVQATIVRSGNVELQPVFLSGASEKGCVVILGDDWTDNFNSASKDTQTLILNAVQFDCAVGGCFTECCKAHSSPRCDDEGISECVCNHSGYSKCCSHSWNDTCVAAVGKFGCGDCATPGACCLSHSTAGCVNRNVSRCVCQQRSSCCSSVWDDQCAALATSANCGAQCPQDCCVSHPTASCQNSAISSCVCKADRFCCDVQWDSFCAQAVEDLGCGTCCS